ncbi:hypothetical protein BDW22DRAFT_1315040, partial [Trametopsis cervina]
EESVHFGFNGTDSFREWYQMLPLGSIAVRQGPQLRLFSVAMFHELHCYRLFHEAFMEKNHGWEHINHCLNYLRQTFMCRADLTREPGNFLEQDFTQERAGPVRVCRNWELLYDELGYNWLDW